MHSKCVEYSLRNYYFLLMSKKEKFYANTKYIDKLVDEIRFKKSEFQNNISIKGIGNRVFSYLSTGEKDYPISKFEDLARGFTKKFKELKNNKIINSHDLIEDKKKDKLHKKDFSCVLYKINDIGNLLYDSGCRKYVYNLTKVTYDTSLMIGNLLDILPNYLKLENPVHNSNNFINEVSKMKWQASFNDSLNALEKKFHISLYQNNLMLPLLSYESTIEHYDEGIYRYEARAEIVPYSIFLFSYTLEQEPTITYNPPGDHYIDFITLNNLIKKNPHSENEFSDNNVLANMTKYYFKKLNRKLPTKFLSSFAIFSNLNEIDFEKLKAEEDMKRFTEIM